MATLGEYIPNSNTKLLLHLNGNSTDSSGNENNGTDINVTYPNGRLGKCASFSGNGSINVGNDISFTGNFTLAVCYKGTATGSGAFITKELGGVNWPQFSFILSTIYPQLKVCSANSGASLVSVTSSVAVNDDKWHSIIATRDGSYIRIYIDGTLTGSTAWTSAQWASTDVVVIGASKYSYSPGYVGNITGLVEEVMAENIAWALPQIAKYHANLLGRYATL